MSGEYGAMEKSSKSSERTVLITGAGKRIGRSIALRLAAAGFHIVVHANHSGLEAESTADAVRRLNVNSWVFTADLSDPIQTEDLMARAIETAGTIDCLVNNASRFKPASLNVFTLDDLMQNVRINAFAPLVLARALAKQNRHGAIVNLLDSRITVYDKAHSSYHLSKRMLMSLTKMMALEFAPGIRVNGVAPGPILPPSGKDEAYLEKLASQNPLKRIGSAEDVAEAVLFLLKNEFVTGQILYIDGGYHMNGRTYE